jgi:hypothetical protein
MNIILTTNQREEPLDKDHRYVCLGPNCWGMSGVSAKEAYKNAKFNAPRGAKRFLTYVAHNSVQIDPVDGALQWTASHNAKDCPHCTCGKGIRVAIE